MKDTNRGSPTVGNLVQIFEASKLLADEAPDMVDPYQRPEKLDLNDDEDQWPALYRLLNLICNGVTGHEDNNIANNDNGDRSGTEKTRAANSMIGMVLRHVITQWNSRRKDPVILYLRYLEGQDSDDDELHLNDEKMQERILDEVAAYQTQQPWNWYTYLFTYERIYKGVHIYIYNYNI